MIFLIFKKRSDSIKMTLVNNEKVNMTYHPDESCNPCSNEAVIMSLESIKAELTFSMIDFTNLAQITSLCDLSKLSFSFDEEKFASLRTSRGARGGEADNLSEILCQVEYIRSLLNIIKLFPAYLVNKVVSKLLRDCANLLKIGYEQVEKTKMCDISGDKQRGRNLIEFLILPIVQLVHECTDITVASHVMLTNKGIKLEASKPKDANKALANSQEAGTFSQKIVTESLMFLLTSAGLSLLKSDYLRILAMSKKVWKFVTNMVDKKENHSLSDGIRLIDEHVARIIYEVISCENGRSFLKVWCEIEVGEIGEPKYPVGLQNLMPDYDNYSELYMVFTPYLNDSCFWKSETGKSVTPILIRQIRQDLLSSKPDVKKRAAFFLKAITSLYFKNKHVFDSETTEVSLITLNDMDVKSYARFWAHFFDLYDILNETQIHIVQPVLSKLNIFKEYADNEAVFVWLPIIMTRMISHDNRTVVKEGLEMFLQTASYLNGQKTNMYKLLAEEFLDNYIFPLIRESVGWILREPEDFFRSITLFSKFLKALFNFDHLLPEFKGAEKVLKFVTSAGKCLSDQTIFFSVSTVDEILDFADDSLNKKTKSEVISQVEYCTTLLSHLLSFNITTVRKFFRELLERRCISILEKIMSFIKCYSELGLNSQLFHKLLSILGLISRRMYFKPELQKQIRESVKYFNEIANENYTNLVTDTNLYQFAKDNLSSTSLLGAFRYLMASSQCQNSVNNFEDVNKAVEKFAVLIVQDFVPGSLHAIHEFYQIYQPNGTKSDVYTKMMIDVNEALTNQANISVQNVIPLACQIEILTSVPETLYEGTEPLFHIVQGDPLKTFLLGKFYVMKSNQCDFIDSNNITDLIDWEINRVDGLDEISKNYIAVTGRNISAELHHLKFEICKRSVDQQVELTGALRLKILETMVDSVEKCDPIGIVSCLKLGSSMQKFINYDEEREITLLDEIASICWGLIFELRKIDGFWQGMRAFAEYIITPFFLTSGGLSKYSDKIYEHGETICGFPLMFMEQFVKVNFQNDLLEMSHQILVKASLAGAPLAKNNRVNFAIWDYLRCKESHDHDPENFSSDCKARILACEKIRSDLHRLKSANTEECTTFGDALLYKVVTQVLMMNDEESILRKRYFGGSSTHRLKQRIFQLLLVLQPYYSYEISKIALRKVLCSLATDSPQPSVRYLGEWLVSLIMEKHVELHSIFFFCLEDGVKTRVGFGAFFATICLQISKFYECPRFYEQALQSLTTLTLGQHVTVRIYAQVAFQRIYEKAKECKFDDVVSKFSSLSTSLESGYVYVTGNCAKLLEHITKDFYVHSFNSRSHYCHEVIFTLLPRLSGVIEDECILHPESISELPIAPVVRFDDVINLEILQSIYREHEKSAWHIKTVVADGRELGEEHANANVCIKRRDNVMSPPAEEDEVFQKKINPWKLLSASEELEEVSNFSTKKRLVGEDGLIVVASLLEHLPNLGGLCRTCEIFGVQKYVVNTLKVINDQNFQSLSVSAQNWVNILEVPIRDLESFLLTYSAKGYAILGIEQANQSVSLTDYKFPKKSVLLLGNEKQGIPSELLHIVDQCIEIPQVGIVRSLNAHMAGGLCIWQYASQHIL